MLRGRQGLVRAEDVTARVLVALDLFSPVASVDARAGVLVDGEVVLPKVLGSSGGTRVSPLSPQQGPRDDLNGFSLMREAFEFPADHLREGRITRFAATDLKTGELADSCNARQLMYLYFQSIFIFQISEYAFHFICVHFICVQAFTVARYRALSALGHFFSCACWIYRYM